MSKVLPYLGGKSQVAQEVISKFPKGPKCYVEPFFGGGGIFFELPAHVYQSRVINDINHNVITFFRVLRNRPEELEQVCRLTPYAKEEWEQCGQLSGGLDTSTPSGELELARRLWVRQSQGFAGRQEHGSPCWARKGAKGPDLALRAANSVELFTEASEHLRKVEVDNLDALEFIGKYAGSNCFIYEDPPYHPSTRVGKSYDHEPDEAWHEQLCKLNVSCTEAGSLIALSGYDNAVYNDLLKGWRKETFERYAPSAMGATEKRRTEVLWLNYPASMELGDRWRVAPVKPSNSREKSLLSGIKKYAAAKNH
jgi:DNA adenine methylase